MTLVTLEYNHTTCRTKMTLEIPFFDLVILTLPMTLTFKGDLGVVQVHAVTAFHDPRCNTF